MPDSTKQSHVNGRLSPDDTAVVIAQMAQLAAAGIPLSDGLYAAAEELPRRQSAALRQLAAAIDAGQTLDQAVVTLQTRLPAHVRGLILAGLRSGQLGLVLER